VQQVRRSEERQAILNAIEEAGTSAQTVRDRHATGMKATNVGYLLTQMTSSGELERVKHHYTPANTH
jgi:hypothetical protein